MKEYKIKANEIDNSYINFDEYHHFQKLSVYHDKSSR